MRLKLMLMAIMLTTATTQAFATDISAIRQLESRIHRYTDSRAAAFLRQFTPESQQQLWEAQSLLHPEWELAETEFSYLYNRLNAALSNLQLAPRRFGTVHVSSQDNPNGLAFRSSPDRGFYLGERLPHGTLLEILADVQGESVSWSTDWLQVAYNGLIGYVHSRYVQNQYVSAHRLNRLATLSRSQLQVQSLLEGWQVAYAPNTTLELETIWKEANRQLAGAGNLFTLPYYRLDALINSLSIDHLNLVTLSRYQLIGDITDLYLRIQDQLQENPDDFTPESRAQLEETFLLAQSKMEDNWQENLAKPQLEELHQLLQEGFRALRRVPTEPTLVIEEHYYYEEPVNWQEILLFASLVIIIPVGGILLFKRKNLKTT